MKDDNNKYVHVVNLAVAHQACRSCYDKDTKIDFCHTCGHRQRIFIGKKSLEQFMKYLVDILSVFRKVICIAHYMKAFDGQFILKYMYENNSQ